MRTHRISTWLTLSLIASVAACSGSKDDGSDDSGTSDADADADTDADTDTDTDTDTDPETSELHGSIVYDNGSPAPNATIRMCSMFCITQESDADGNFSFDAMKGDLYAFDAETHEEEGHATLLTFLSLAQDEVRTLDLPVILPAFTTTQIVNSAQEVEVASDLIIAVDPAGYNPPLGTPDDDPAMISGVTMDPLTAGLPLDLTDGLPEDFEGGQVVALWYLGVWNTVVDPAWSFRTTSDSGLEPGTTLRILSGDYLGLSWVEGGTATVQGDGTIASDSGSGIHLLSTLVLVQ